MANIIFAEQENAHLHAPTLKMRQRLQSAPEKLLKSPMIAKTLNTPLPSGRKAFGAVNKKNLTPALNAQEKKLLKSQETQVNNAAQTKAEEYPEIEKFIPYDPLEFVKYSIPEDLVCVSGFALPGLARFPQAPHLCEEDLEKFAPLPDLSPVKMPKRSGIKVLLDYCSELDAFLQTLDELTIELPPESITD
ncbi:securin-like isoform X1 [Seriola lalandi dorsalis]|uniref:securin-like isoform X1 n=1 Tax=Seriola lalandi dorsalis TaxID=1841481 RepID=UPI000C6F5500|nr:securin-like isoform X1 [Seriola lalandi dorsalis]XP_023253790.1 securin-like isoform X1 [Seriola lalandi dorsalis]XP_023253791.1 securin-like isoform X1 [Seriola lalandi dorsalis]